jgi:hypothetical protein
VDTYLAPLDSALAELEAWKTAESPSGKVSAAFYENLRSMILDAKAIHENEGFYQQIADINRYICDEGPLSGQFIPSFKALFLSHYASRKKKNGG